MNDINQLVDQRYNDLKTQFEQFDLDGIKRKIDERKGLLESLEKIEKELASALGRSVDSLFGKGHLGSSSSTPASKETVKPEAGKRRKSLSEDEKRDRIATLLKNEEAGLSAAKIAEQIGDTYNTVIKHLANAELYSKTGTKISTRYRLVLK